ncbi:MAG: hypothetical protein HXS52_00295 [Theionarchaea archaeon]|nr:hypothetical protein [Theionarchaea archaeon]MBU7036341.1 hypothetical protein [Theionarchaea archaeon]
MAKLNVEGPLPSNWKKAVSWRVVYEPNSGKFRVCIWVEGVQQCFVWDNLSADTVHVIIYLLGLDGRRWGDPSSRVVQVEGGVGKWT